MIQPGKTYHLDQMSVDEKVDLVNDLWDSLSALPKQHPPAVIDEDAMRAEARRLLADKIISIEGMTLDERIILAQELWDSVADEPGAIRLTPAQRAELDRRIAEDDADPSSRMSEEEFWAALREGR